jgi:hypothetical protein
MAVIFQPFFNTFRFNPYSSEKKINCFRTALIEVNGIVISIEGEILKKTGRYYKEE